MLAALHPLLLWGLAAVAVPILIHLLLRTRPKPRPWGAMRWLQLAAQAASRRWRLTNLLLLILRCLAVALLALGVARLSIPGLGGGDHLVVAVDTTVGMGPRRDDPGSLAAAIDPLSRWLAEAPWGAVTVITAGPEPREVVRRVSPAAAADAVRAIEAGPLPGGFDDGRAGGWAAADGAQVLLVGDFQQDDGGRLTAALAGARGVARWSVARPAGNAWMSGVASVGDLLPGRGGEIHLTVGGEAGGAALAVDGGPFLALPAAPAGGRLTVAVPPLAAGPHRLRIRIEDDGLLADDLIDLPLVVRGPVPALVVRSGRDWLAAALAADAQLVATTVIGPADLSAQPLPEGGIVALRAGTADGARLARWVAEGGILWATPEILRRDPDLRRLVPATAGRAVGGALAVADADLAPSFATAPLADLELLPPGGEALLTAGTAAAVAAYPVGNGHLVLEVPELGADAGFTSRGAVSAWALRAARRLAAAADLPRQLVAGAAATAAMTLHRDGRTVRVAAGEPLRIEAGTWEWELGNRRVPALVLPDPAEGRLDRPVPAGAATDPARALPHRPGADLGWWCLVAAFAVLIAEGLLAAWAGRRYAG